MSVTAGEGWPLGPGVLKIGATGTEIDISCLINNAVIAASKNQGDNVTKLCGDVVPGATTYDYTIGGNVDLDIAEATGFFALTQDNPGTQQDFTFTPNNDAGTTATGKCIIDPLDFGGGTTTETMAADFEFALVGQPAYTYGDGTGAAADEQRELVEA
jgi:hypothetical protein